MDPADTPDETERAVRNRISNYETDEVDADLWNEENANDSAFAALVDHMRIDDEEIHPEGNAAHSEATQPDLLGNVNMGDAENDQQEDNKSKHEPHSIFDNNADTPMRDAENYPHPPASVNLDNNNKYDNGLRCAEFNPDTDYTKIMRSLDGPPKYPRIAPAPPDVDDSRPSSPSDTQSVSEEKIDPNNPYFQNTPEDNIKLMRQIFKDLKELFFSWASGRSEPVFREECARDCVRKRMKDIGTILKMINAYIKNKKCDLNLTFGNDDDETNAVLRESKIDLQKLSGYHGCAQWVRPMLHAMLDLHETLNILPDSFTSESDMMI